jgi:hypothetical protein
LAPTGLKAGSLSFDNQKSWFLKTRPGRLQKKRLKREKETKTYYSFSAEKLVGSSIKQ